MPLKGQVLTPEEKLKYARHPRDRSWDQAADAAQKKRLEQALRDCEGNITAAAAEIGLGRTYVMALLDRLDLSEFARDLRRKHWGRPSGRGRPPA